MDKRPYCDRHIRRIKQKKYNEAVDQIMCVIAQPSHGPTTSKNCHSTEVNNEKENPDVLTLLDQLDEISKEKCEAFEVNQADNEFDRSPKQRKIDELSINKLNLRKEKDISMLFEESCDS